MSEKRYVWVVDAPHGPLIATIRRYAVARVTPGGTYVVKTRSGEKRVSPWGGRHFFSTESAAREFLEKGAAGALADEGGGP